MAEGRVTSAAVLMKNLYEHVDIAVRSSKSSEHGPEQIYLGPVCSALHGFLREFGKVPHDTQLLHSAEMGVRDAPLL
jgi:hypothetical protein